LQELINIVVNSFVLHKPKLTARMVSEKKMNVNQNFKINFYLAVNNPVKVPKHNEVAL